VIRGRGVNALGNLLRQILALRDQKELRKTHLNNGGKEKPAYQQDVNPKMKGGENNSIKYKTPNTRGRGVSLGHRCFRL